MREMILATRGSALAMAQAESVQNLLSEAGIPSELRRVTTKGDRDRTHALREIGGSGLFVREIEKEILSGRADAAVHSGKDLPYELEEHLVIACVPKAADPRDCLIARRGYREIRVIGTGSARRIAELSPLFPGAVFRDIRGNVPTRLRKLEEGAYDAVVLAKAGLDRLSLDLSPYDVRILEPESVIPACAQGILAVECRADRSGMIRALQKINDVPTWKRFTAERYLFRLMKADCAKAVGIHSGFGADGSFTLMGFFEGRKAVRTGPYESYPEMSREIRDEIYL